MELEQKLQVDRLNFNFQGRHIFYDLDINFKNGVLNCLTGPNGCGKTTLLRLMTGILKPLTGGININGKKIQDYSSSEMRNLIGYVPVESEQAGFTVDEAIDVHQMMQNSMGADYRKRAFEWLMKLELIHLKNQSLSTLSSGEKFRVYFALAMASDPRWLFLDEPDSHLDWGHAARIFQLLKNMCRNGKGVIVSTHDVNRICVSSENVTLLDGNGSVAYHGAPDSEFTTKLTTMYTGALRSITDAGRNFVLPEE